MTSRKTRKLTLEFSRVDLNYRVTKAIDTVAYSPGDVLTKVEVESLCQKAGWSVTVVPITPAR